MISVCMATYNGEKYINFQIHSILKQLEVSDELIISDDGSSDLTISIIKGIKDPRIRFFRNSFQNVSKNFEFAIVQAKGDYIFLSDQDDIWRENKVNIYLKQFKNNAADLLVSNLAFIDGDGRQLEGEFFKSRFRSGVFRNLIRNNFIGCSMAFRSGAKKWILPFPEDLPMHDWWIGLIIGRRGKIAFIEEKLLLYRRHETNVTSGRQSSIINIIKWRWTLLKHII